MYCLLLAVLTSSTFSVTFSHLSVEHLHTRSTFFFDHVSGNAVDSIYASSVLGAEHEVGITLTDKQGGS